MSQDDSGDKTEQPTPKKLQDARKKGQVPKSKDVTSTVELLVWFALALLAVGWATLELKGLMAQMLQVLHEPFANAAHHRRHLFGFPDQPDHGNHLGLYGPRPAALPAVPGRADRILRLFLHRQRVLQDR